MCPKSKTKLPFTASQLINGQANMTLVITGTFEVPSNDLVSFLEGLGASVQVTVSKEVDFLIHGKDPDDEMLVQARMIHIPTMTHQAFMNCLVRSMVG